MLNYLWAGLILFAVVFALVADTSDLRNHVYANDAPLDAILTYHDAADSAARQTNVDVQIEPANYWDHFHAKDETLAASYPAIVTRLEKGLQLRFAKDVTLPPRLAAMRDFADSKELTAAVTMRGSPAAREQAVELLFPPVRFVKLRAITTAAIDMAQTAVELSLKLTGVLALWLGLMKIGESAGLIDAMVKIIQPILRPLFPDVPEGHPAMGYIAINLAGNILGLNNATTAMGLKAMEELQKLNPTDDTATDPMVMLLALHTAAFQLVPSATLVAVMGFGAAEVYLPMLLVGLIATVVAAVAAKVLGRLPMYRRTKPQRTRDGASPEGA
jgi:spore maturation protein A